MKIKRFTAKSMREAIRQVREEQGPDAVILSNRRVPGGVEVVAATDYDAALAQQALRQMVPTAEAQPVSTPLQPPHQPTDPTPSGEPPKRRSTHKPESSEAALRATPAVPPQASEIALMQRELGDMRRLLEEQLSGLVWNEMKRNQPQRAALLKALAGLGLDADLARSIVDEVPADTDFKQVRLLPQDLLARRIPASGADPIQEGGVVALIGPTGVGKTTTIAKLAARYAQHHSPRDIVLVTLDHYRIGAQEQLYSYGRLLGVPVHAVQPDQNLGAVLDRLGDHRLVLIDTAGMGPRDRTLQQQLQRLAALGTRLRSHLVVAANAANPEDVLQRFGTLNPVGVVLTKLDEAGSIGPALSAVMRHGLPLSYITQGQRVPEDLHLAHADRLALYAAQLAKVMPKAIDEGSLAARFVAPSTSNASTPASAHA
jgi:flagellar biosynthesis protein FlhF